MSESDDRGIKCEEEDGREGRSVVPDGREAGDSR